MVTDLKFSAFGKYIACCNTSGLVQVWVHGSQYLKIQYVATSDCMIAWHPWKEDDLIIGTYLII